MRKAIVALVFIFVSGCGGPTRSATPDLNTPAGYRQGAIIRAERAVIAVNTANTSCTTAAINQCQQSLKAQESIYLQTPELAPLGGIPLICDRLAHDYYILLNGTRDYFNQMKTSAARGDQVALDQTAKERMVSFNQSRTAFNNTLSSDPCR